PGPGRPGAGGTNGAGRGAAGKPPRDPRAYRLSNTREGLAQLARNERAILLGNALIDTGAPRGLAIRDSLRAGPGHGSYVVQARGAVDQDFRARLAAAGAGV